MRGRGLALRERGCLLQAIARRYYLVYTVATYCAANCGITVVRRRSEALMECDQFTHNELPDVVRALYTGLRSGNVGPGRHAGLVGAVLNVREAVRYVQDLQWDRKDADYGYLEKIEVYDTAQADRRLNWANGLVADLRKLL